MPDAPRPALTRRDPEKGASGVVLMLHGGRADALTPVDHRSASWRRSRWMMQHVSGRINRAGAGVWLLRYGVRGWNAAVASPPSPVADARWALEQVRHELGAVPVVLLGHSMGGRTAVAVADDPQVVGWRRGCRRPTRSAPWPAGTWRPRTARATGSPLPARRGRSAAARRAWRRPWSSTTWAGWGTTCSATCPRGTGSQSAGA